MDRARLRTILVWVGSVVLALMFLMTGGTKLANADYTGTDNTWEEQMVEWGYPGWFRWVVGLGEVLWAIGLLIPLARPYAAAGLVVIMLGAVVTHVANGEASMVVVPVLLAAISFLLGWTTRPAWARRARPAAS